MSGRSSGGFPFCAWTCDTAAAIHLYLHSDASGFIEALSMVWAAAQINEQNSV